jgi:hypothetical protein
VVNPAAAVAPGWQLVSTGTGELNAVSCVASECVAVGSSAIGNGSSPLIETGSGSTWTVIPGPDPLTFADLDAVSCTSAAFCMAVGRAIESPSYTTTPISEVLHGDTWTYVAIPNSSSAAWLTGVSCTSATECTAVGSTEEGSDETLIETWNGTAWTAVSSPNPGDQNLLTGVSCVRGTSFCAASGRTFNIYDQMYALVETTDGAGWTAVQVSPVQWSGLDGISCTSPTFCMGVGSIETGKQPPFTTSWNGVTWTQQLSPSSARLNTPLLGVACPSPNLCVAAGTSHTRDRGDFPYLERWTESNWTKVGKESVAEVPLLGVSCSSHGACTGVGGLYDSSIIYSNEPQGA